MRMKAHFSQFLKNEMNTSRRDRMKVGILTGGGD